MSRRTWRTLGGAAGLSTLLVVTWGPAGPAWADGPGAHPDSPAGQAPASAGTGGDAPAGNNGTVRIDDEATPNQDNDPHIGCDFSVSFYGYDSRTQTGKLTFVGQAPTRGSGSVTLSAGWRTADRTGGDQLDQTVPVSFSQLAGLFKGVAPAHQGYHVRLTATVSGSQGSDVKHKVFWIDCPPGPAGPASSGPASSGSSNGASSVGASSVGVSSVGVSSNGGAPAGAPTTPASGPRTALAAVEGLTLAAPGSPAPAAVTVAGASSATPVPIGTGSAPLAPAGAGAAVAGSTLAFTGFRALGAAGLGTGLLAGGSALAVLARRRRRS